jgi:hypothetical protein
MSAALGPDLARPETATRPSAVLGQSRSAQKA